MYYLQIVSSKEYEQDGQEDTGNYILRIITENKKEARKIIELLYERKGCDR